MERPTYAWSYAFSWGLTGSGGTLAVVSVLAYFMPALFPADAPRTLCVLAFACMVGFSVACANCTAAAAQHAIARGKFYGWTFGPALLCTAGFCVTTWIGMRLGWTLMTQGLASHDLPDARMVNGAEVFIALAKPAMNWIIEGRKGIDKDEADATEAAENAREDAMRQARIAASHGSNVTQLKPRSRRASGAAALALGVAIGAPHGVSEAAPQIQLDASSDMHAETQAASDASPMTQRRARKTRPDHDARLAEARLLLASEAPPSNRQIARQTQLSASTVDRLAREMTPLRNVA